MSAASTPWTFAWHDDDSHNDGFEILDAESETVADDGSAWGEYTQKMSEETAHRIIACVNACYGIPIEVLQAGFVAEAVVVLGRIAAMSQDAKARVEARVVINKLNGVSNG